MRPGDRRQRWQSTCNIEGTIILLIGAFFCYAGLTATKGGWIVLLFGGICILCAVCDFCDASRGWRMVNDRPPWADEHDLIDLKHGREPLNYNPNKWKGNKRARYAFEYRKLMEERHNRSHAK